MTRSRRNMWFLWLAGLVALGCIPVHVVDNQDDLQRATSLGRVAYSLPKAIDRMTPEDEYYLGRAVAARLVSEYGVVVDPAATAYLNRVGHLLALQSDRPYVFEGYHFILLDSDEVNAFACPGAFVFVTRGMLRRLAGEDMLAAVLAHEIAHVQNRDGKRAIEEKYWRKFWNLALDQALAELTTPVVGALSQALGAMAGDYYRILTSKGFDKAREAAADAVVARSIAAGGPDAVDVACVLDLQMRYLAEIGAVGNEVGD